MTFGKLQRYLDELLATDHRFDADVVAIFKRISRDWFGVSKAEWQFLEEKVLGEHGDRFVDEASRQELACFWCSSEVRPGPLGAHPALSFLHSRTGEHLGGDKPRAVASDL